jgi:thioredoxin reductase (NADPH)
MAALEAEKYLAELEAVENPLETENEVKKSNSNVVVPEYHSNPLL